MFKFYLQAIYIYFYSLNSWHFHNYFMVHYLIYFLFFLIYFLKAFIKFENILEILVQMYKLPFHFIRFFTNFIILKGLNFISVGFFSIKFISYYYEYFFWPKYIQQLYKMAIFKINKIINLLKINFL